MTQQANIAIKPSAPIIPNSMGDYQFSWITDYAWVSGLLGALAVVVLAIIYWAKDVFNQGVFIGSYQFTANQQDALVIALLLISGFMVLAEVVRIGLRKHSAFIVIHPKLIRGRYTAFIVECCANYLGYLGLLSMVVFFYHYAGEYGFQQHASYYQPWFRFLDLVFYAFLYAGLPYVLLTRAIKFSSHADEYDYGFYFLRLIYSPFHKFFGFDHFLLDWSGRDKKITLGFMVKLFFTPLMTVFFFDQFPHLVNNIGYLLDGFWQALMSGGYTNNQLNDDLYNISISFIFSIDVALAWCGYVVSSRWVDNQTLSAEPSVLGWLVCLLCYPPFQRELGVYFSPPGETQAIYLFHQQWLITLCLVLMICSYLVYMSATVCFGTRFSNLTHRGIVRKGPFAFVRHPAYASKNFAWWCIMFPAVIYSAFNQQLMPAVLQILGLLLMTYIYYWRALTEERHLASDPAYVEYCQHVKYRFIPGVM